MRLSNVIRGQLRISWCNICNIISFVDMLFLATFESRHNTKAKLGIIVFQMIEYIINIFRDMLSSFMEEYLHLVSVHVLFSRTLLRFDSLLVREVANYASKLIMNKVGVDFPLENEKTCFDTLRSMKMLFNVVLCNK